MHLHSCRSLLLLLLFTAPAARSQTPDGRPLRADTAWTLETGQHAVELGLDYRPGFVPVALLDPSNDGVLLRVPVVRWRVGLGRAEFQLSGAAWQRFEPDRAGASRRDAVGDFTLWLKMRAWGHPDRGPVLGFAFGAKMPNTSDTTGLGTDESDVFGQVLLSRSGPRHELRLNLGLAILGDPLRNGSQEDLMTYALAGRHGGRHGLLWEVWGRALGQGSRNLDESTLRLGWERSGARYGVDACALVGLTDGSGDVGFTAGVTMVLGPRRAGAVPAAAR